MILWIINRRIPVNVFIFQSALYCEECGEDIRNGLTEAGEAPADIDDESSYCSDKFPKGPYRNGGGEADSPQHCDCCRAFLQNPLTGDGYEYVRKAVDYLADVESGDSEYTLSERLAAKFRELYKPVLAEWCAYYPEAFDTPELQAAAAYDDDDGQPDESQEWHDYDRDC